MRHVLVVAAILSSLGSAQAAVTWHDWQETGIQTAVDRAVAERKLVLLVVTQPDWCPPCIRLNVAFLQNPEERRVAKLATDMLVLEVHGYDAAGARVLEEQRVRFQGTPTSFVFRPERAGRPLGEARLLGSVVGAPDDFPKRLESIVAGHDPVADLERALASAGDPADRARLGLELGDLHVSRGRADEAERAYSAAETSAREAGDDELARTAAWRRPARVDLRVRKDFAAALEGIDAHVARHGVRPDEREDVAYARSWALVKLGRVADARRELERAFLTPETPGGLSTYAYFAFRSESRPLLKDAERRVRLALAQEPDNEASLLAALGRLLRRQGMLGEAAAAFERAVELAPSESARVVYLGQLEFVRGEMRGQG